MLSDESQRIYKQVRAQDHLYFCPSWLRHIWTTPPRTMRELGHVPSSKMTRSREGTRKDVFLLWAQIPLYHSVPQRWTRSSSILQNPCSTLGACPSNPYLLWFLKSLRNPAVCLSRWSEEHPESCAGYVTLFICDSTPHHLTVIWEAARVALLCWYKTTQSYSSHCKSNFP